MTPESLRSLTRIAAGAVLVAIVVWLMMTLSTVATLLLTTLALAYILNPLVNWMTKIGFNRPVASGLIIIVGLLIINGAIFFFIPAVMKEVRAFLDVGPQYFAKVGEQIVKLAEWLGVNTPSDWNEVYLMVVERLRLLLPKMADPAAKIASTVFTSTIHIFSLVFYALLIPVFTYYLMVSFESIKSTIYDLIPPYTREPVVQRLRQIDTMMAGFVRGQLTICIILSVLYSLGFVIIGIDLPVVLGTLSGMLFIIPYVGTAFGIITGSIMALAKFGDFVHVAYVIGWITAVQLLEGYVLTPKIVGEAVGLHPVLYIVALMVGGTLMGFMGMLIAIPSAAIIRVLLMTLVDGYKRTYLYDDSVDGPEQL